MCVCKCVHTLAVATEGLFLSSSITAYLIFVTRSCLAELLGSACVHPSPSVRVTGEQGDTHSASMWEWGFAIKWAQFFAFTAIILTHGATMPASLLLSAFFKSSPTSFQDEMAGKCGDSESAVDCLSPGNCWGDSREWTQGKWLAWWSPGRFRHIGVSLVVLGKHNRQCE